MEATYMFIGRQMDKEVLVHIHNGILLSYKKEHIWVTSNEVDEAGAYFTKWSKSERETLIQYINTYIYGILKDGNNDPICKAAKETQM